MSGPYLVLQVTLPSLVTDGAVQRVVDLQHTGKKTVSQSYYKKLAVASSSKNNSINNFETAGYNCCMVASQDVSLAGQASMLQESIRSAR